MFLTILFSLIYFNYKVSQIFDRRPPVRHLFARHYIRELLRRSTQNKHVSIKHLSFLNNFLNKILLIKKFSLTKSGISTYAIQLLFVRFKVNWSLAYAKMQILKITHDEQEGTIKIRWRINGVRAMRTFFQPWKIKVWKIKETIKENESQEK